MKTKERIISMMLMLMALAMGTKVMAGTKEAYAVFTTGNNGTLTFYYDDERDSKYGKTYSLNSDYDVPEWITDMRLFETVVFHDSFADARPTSTYKWFYEMKNLTSITGIGYLNTSNVTDMSYMFNGCESLKSLNLSSFNTVNVTNMYRMFNYCKSLEDLDVSNFNTANVTDMDYMFQGCKSLEELNISSFQTHQVFDMYSMFRDCTNLKRIYVGSGWWMTSYFDVISEYMFYGCTSLVGEHNTTYDENCIDARYAHVDGGTSNPGYFTTWQYNLKIQGNNVTYKNKDDVLNDGRSVTFDNINNTLTLDYAEIDEGNDYPAIEVFDMTGLTIEVKGDCMLASSEPALSVYNNSSVTITGPGKLNLTSREMEAINVKNSTLKLDKAKVYARGKASALNGTGSAMTVNYSLLEASSDKETQATISGFTSFQMTNSKFEDVINGSDELFYGDSFFYNAGDKAIWYAGYYYPDEGHGGQYDYDNSYPYKVKISPVKPSISTNINEAYGQRDSVKGQKDERYNLSGQRVGKDYKGIVIINGVKTVVK